MDTLEGVLIGYGALVALIVPMLGYRWHTRRYRRRRGMRTGHRQ